MELQQAWNSLPLREKQFYSTLIPPLLENLGIVDSKFALPLVIFPSPTTPMDYVGLGEKLVVYSRELEKKEKELKEQINTITASFAPIIETYTKGIKDLKEKILAYRALNNVQESPLHLSSLSAKLVFSKGTESLSIAKDEGGEIARDNKIFKNLPDSCFVLSKTKLKSLLKGGVVVKGCSLTRGEEIIKVYK